MYKLLSLRYILILILSLVIKDENSSYGLHQDYEILEIFLSQMKDDSYLNQNIKGDRDEFNRYLALRKNDISRFYLSYDSICNNSKNTITSTRFCSLANSYLKTYSFLEKVEINKNDIIDSKINNIGKIDFEKLLHIKVLKHSKSFYDIGIYDWASVYKLEEEPSINIRGLYYTKNQQKAFIKYSINVKGGLGQIKIFLLQKKKGLLWKPIGSI